MPVRITVAARDDELAFDPAAFRNMEEVVAHVRNHFGVAPDAKQVVLYDLFENRCEPIDHINELKCLKQGIVYGTPKEPLRVVVDGEVLWRRRVVPIGVTYKDPRNPERFKVWEFHVEKDCTRERLQKFLAMQSGVPVEEQTLLVGTVLVATGTLPWSRLRDGEFATPYTGEDGIYREHREWGNCLHLMTNRPVP